jgi:hypothetical protein
VLVKAVISLRLTEALAAVLTQQAHRLAGQASPRIACSLISPIPGGACLNTALATALVRETLHRSGEHL